MQASKPTLKISYQQYFVTGIPSGKSLAFTMRIKFWTVSKSDVMPNWYMASPGLEPRLIESTADGQDFVSDFDLPQQYKRYEQDSYEPFTPEDRYKR